MNSELLDKVIEIVSPFVKNKEALKSVSEETTFLKDLEVSSSRLVDIILAIEDTFGIEVSDEDADTISTIGAAVSLIESRSA
ncbi:MAG: acyl carrier protein [Deltaproteobacteria bacterium]|nr:acyl carrier protein [Deltaproteobacteria bacterium]